MPPPYTFKCGCGKTQIKISEDPFATLSCHCHSCVASCQFVDAKGGDNNTSGILAGNGGVAWAMLKPTGVGEITISDSGLGACIVGPKGKNSRVYAKCCNTFIGFNAEGKAMGLNFNAMHNEDGSKYMPPGKLENWMKKYAFDPSKVPEPSYSMGPIMAIVKMMLGVMLNPFAPKFDTKEPPLSVDSKEYEIVPITWE